MKNLYYALLGLDLLALLFLYRKLPRRLLVFLPLILLVLATQLAAQVLESRNVEHYFLFHLYIPAEYILLSIYYSFLFPTKTARWLLVLSNLALTGFCLFYYYLGPSFWKPDYTHFVIESIFVCLCVVCFFIQLFRNEENISLLTYPDYWINSGNLFFYAGCTFVMGLHFSLRATNPDLANSFLAINHYLNLLLYLFYLIAFLCLTRTSAK